MKLYIFLVYLPFSLLCKQIFQPRGPSQSPYSNSFSDPYSNKTPDEMIRQAINETKMPEMDLLTNQLPNESNDGLHSFK